MYSKNIFIWCLSFLMFATLSRADDISVQWKCTTAKGKAIYVSDKSDLTPEWQCAPSSLPRLGRYDQQKFIEGQKKPSEDLQKINSHSGTDVIAKNTGDSKFFAGPNSIIPSAGEKASIHTEKNSKEGELGQISDLLSKFMGTQN